MDEWDNNNNTYKKKNRNRKRKAIWFNPHPTFWNLSSINIGSYFFNLIDKPFPKDNSLSKIFNRNILKISYPFTNNISKIINNYDRKLIDKSHIIWGQIKYIVIIGIKSMGKKV